MKKLLPFFLLLFGINASAQTNLYVDSSMTASGAGTSWATAYKTLNEALNVVNATSTTTKYVVNIAKGTYYPTGAQSGTNRDSTFLLMRGGVMVYGGYPTGGGTRNAASNPTILSGNIGAAGVSADNSYHVMLVGGAITSTSDTVALDGLRIVGGYANGTGTIVVNGTGVARNAGGGLYMLYIPTGKAFVNGCTFSGDTVLNGNGGGMYLNISEATLSNCTFTNNAAPNGYGGGICGASFLSTAGLSVVSVRNTTFSSNMAMGGGAYANIGAGVSSASVTQNITSCQFTANKATLNGGAILDSTNNTYSSNIKNSKFSSNTAQNGGGLYMNHSFAIVRDTFVSNNATINGGGSYLVSLATSSIDTCLYIGNKAVASGGGMFYGTSGIVNSVTFTADSATQGGGAYAGGASSFVHCTFQINYAAQGGGMYRVGASNVSKGIFSGNRATLQGGGMFSSGGSPTIENTLFSGNKANISGGALYDTTATNPTITFCTFARDTAIIGNGIYNANSSQPLIRNSIVWESTANGIVNTSGSATTVSYTTVQGGAAGTGNSSSDPLFIAPVPSSFAPTTSGNYGLLPCSPAIDAGQNLTAYATTTDLKENSRLFGSGYDMGAYEIQPTFPSPITGGNSLCTNGTLQLSNQVTGGSWSSTNTSIATVNSSGLVSPVGVGVDTINYSATNGPCSMTVRQIITVNLAPAISSITGKSVLCAKDTIHLNNATAGGSWVSLNSSIAIVDIATGAVKGISGGNDTINYYIANLTNGCVSQVSKIVTVNDTPAILASSGLDSICVRSTTLLTNITFGGAWSSSDTSIATIDAFGVVSGRNVGNANIIYTVTNGNGCVGSGAKTMTIKGPIKTVSQSGPHLMANQAGAIYQWLNCNAGMAAIAGQTSQTFTPDSNGQYAVAILFQGCLDTSACLSVTNVGVSTPGSVKAKMSVYPNPASGQVTVKVWTGSDEGKVLLRDMAGKLIQETELKGDSLTLDVSRLSAGIYVVELQDGHERYQQRLSIVR